MTSTTEKALLVCAVATIALVTCCTLRADEAPSYPCPAGVPSCKIVVMTPDEERTLVGPEMLFDHAAWANQVKFGSMIQAWREKLRQAPQGVVQTEDKK